MAVKYLAGDRLIGTAAERAALETTSQTAIPQTSWKELDRVTLGSAGDTLDTGTFAAKDNLMVLIHEIGSGSITGNLQFNSDTGDNYSQRISENGASGSATADTDKIRVDRGNSENFIICKIRNDASQEKLLLGECAGNGAAGAANYPERWESVGKWANTSNQITSIQLQNTSGGSFDTGSEMVVLGCDDDEADSGTNFWQELADVDLSGGTATSMTATITAKKWLWIQAHSQRSTASSIANVLRFNGDTGSNYANRRTNDGDTGAPQGWGDQNVGAIAWNATEKHYVESYMINKSSTEKLVMSETIDYNTSGAGAGTAPKRSENIFKWDNTSAQVTTILFLDQDGLTFATNTGMRVWGAD